MSDELSSVYLKNIENDMKKSLDTALNQQEYIVNSTAKYHGNYVRTCYMPKIFDEKEYEYFGQIVNDLYDIFRIVINRYFDDSSYRQLFGFGSLIDSLILRCDRNELVVPISRIDIFFNEKTGDFKFCEFNTDGTSAMNEDRELNNSLKFTSAYKEFCENNTVTSLELFDTWVDLFLKEYRRISGNINEPVVAVIDFLESASMEEFLEFKSRFELAGVKTYISEIRDLSYDGSKLRTKDGIVIDAIYRRAVTSDIINHYNEVLPLINAVEDGNVVMFGDFFTQIIHNKILYKVLWNKETMDMLSDTQKEFIKQHVPETHSASLVDIETILSDKDKWILKPEDSYGSRGVYPGCELTQEEWENIVNNKITLDNYILQEFYTPYPTENYQLENNQLIKHKYYNLTGLYVYFGSIKGIYSRISRDRIISTQYNEMALATIVVNNRI